LEPGYKVVDIAGYAWLIRSDRIERISGMDVRYISDINDESSNIIHNIFRQRNLLDVPASWGRSFSTLKSKMRQVYEVPKDVPTTLNSVAQLGNGHYRVIGDDPFVRFDISDLRLRGRDAGIMSFDFSCESIGAPPAPGIEIYWASSGNAESEITSVILDGRSGLLIVPMDAAPAWLLATHILSLRLDIRNRKHCSEFKLENIRFFQRQSAR
jgi:hypothetical protein